MHELPPTGVRVRVGISFKLGVIVLPMLPLFYCRMRLFVYYIGFRSLSLFRSIGVCVVNATSTRFVVLLICVWVHRQLETLGSTKRRDPGSGISGTLISKTRYPKRREYRDLRQNACYLMNQKTTI